MTEKINTTKNLLERLEQAILQLRQNQDNAITEVGELLPELTGIFRELFEMADKHITEIPVNILIQQLENFEEFYQQQDVVQLADTLEYEMRESVCFYIEILKSME